MDDLRSTRDETRRLRDLAKKQMEYASLPIMKEREKLWYRHNDLQGEVPMIHFETGTCEQDLLPPLECRSEAARQIELQLVRTMLNHEMIDDDRVVPPYYEIRWSTSMVLFDEPVKRTHAKDSKGGGFGYRFIHPIKNLPEDISHLKPSAFISDKQGTLKWKAFVEELIGDILPVKIAMDSLRVSLTQHIVHLMGMEGMIFAMMDYPDEFRMLSSRIVDDYLAYFRWLESEGLLLLNNGNNGLRQGSFGFTDTLPKPSYSVDKGIRTTDLWGYMDSQETVSISPEMFKNFFFPCYFKVAENFGALSYGCCEPVYRIWDNCISELPNLRKVSISPWCDEEYMGQALKGSGVIYHRKPSPNYVGVGKELDEEDFKRHIRKTLESAMGCKLEFSFRDVYNLEGNDGKPRRAVQIVRELIDDCWR